MVNFSFQFGFGISGLKWVKLVKHIRTIVVKFLAGEVSTPNLPNSLISVHSKNTGKAFPPFFYFFLLRPLPPPISSSPSPPLILFLFVLLFSFFFLAFFYVSPSKKWNYISAFDLIAYIRKFKHPFLPCPRLIALAFVRTLQLVRERRVIYVNLACTRFNHLPINIIPSVRRSSLPENLGKTLSKFLLEMWKEWVRLHRNVLDCIVKSEWVKLQRNFCEWSPKCVELLHPEWGINKNY